MKLKWQQAPVKTQWGDEMVVASVAIDKDHTVCLYCERDQTPKVDAMFALAEQPAQGPVQCHICRAEDSPYPKCGHVTYVEHPTQQDHVVCCGEFETCTQACTPRGRFLGKREALAQQPAQQEPVAILNHAHGIHTVRSVKLNGLPDGEYNLYTSPQPPAPAPGFCKNCKDYTVEAPLAEQPAQQEPSGWRPATFHRDNLSFNPGFPDEQTVKFWKLQGVEIEYCYTSPLLLSPGATLYTSPPPQRTWVGLSDLNIDELENKFMRSAQTAHQFLRAIEAKLKEKNT